MDLKKAEDIAKEWVILLKQYCLRIEIAGSIRRRKQQVGDIELVLIPDSYKFEVFAKDYFNLKNGINVVKNGGKYKQIHLIKEDINIDIFICTKDTFPMNFLIRTGSAQWIRNLMIELRKREFYCKGAMLCKMESGCCDEDYNYLDFVVPEIEEEKDIFNRIGMIWVDPEKRI